MEKKFAYLLSTIDNLASKPKSIILDKEEKIYFEREWSDAFGRATFDRIGGQTT
jgi:hypothetical protein